jgi:hypothetical protein
MKSDNSHARKNVSQLTYMEGFLIMFLDPNLESYMRGVYGYVLYIEFRELELGWHVTS